MLKPKLKLVQGNAAKHLKLTGPRPVTIHYSWGYTGHCKSVKNAIKVATKHLLDERTKRVNIEVDGMIVADLELLQNRVVTWWQRGWLEFGTEQGD